MTHEIRHNTAGDILCKGTCGGMLSDKIGYWGPCLKPAVTDGFCMEHFPKTLAAIRAIASQHPETPEPNE